MVEMPSSHRLLDRLRAALRTHHYSRRTEQAYSGWVRRYILFHGKRHPEEMGEMNNLVRAQRPQRLPLVLTRSEVSRILAEMEGPTLLMASLLYGAGLRLLECCRLRTKDLDFERREILLRNGKGRKDRVTMLPESLASDLTTHLEGVQELHCKDLADGMGSVELPAALERKYPRAPWEWGCSGSSRPRAIIWMGTAAGGEGITCTSRSFRRPSRRPFTALRWQNPPARTP